MALLRYSILQLVLHSLRFGSVENMLRCTTAPLWRFPKTWQDRRDKKWPFWHRGQQTGWQNKQKHDETDEHS